MDEECSTGYSQSSFGCFIQKNDDEESESVSSLSSFIKAHSSRKQAKPSQLLSESLDDADTCNSLSSYISKSLNSTNLINVKSSIHEKPDKSDDYGTLEEYTKSFLTSKGNFSIPNRFRTQSENSNADVADPSSDLTSVSEHLSKVHITDSSKTDSSSDQWNIDLSVALQCSKTKPAESDKICESNESTYEPKIYLAHVHLCNLDISSLANEKLPYSNSILSSFGYVLNRKWPKLPLPRKLKKIGKNWPYNKSKSFKFNSPSPDDIILQKKAKMRTNSFNDA